MLCTPIREEGNEPFLLIFLEKPGGFNICKPLCITKETGKQDQRCNLQFVSIKNRKNRRQGRIRYHQSPEEAYPLNDRVKHSVSNTYSKPTRTNISQPQLKCFSSL